MQNVKNSDLPMTLRVDDVAKILGISRAGAYNLVKSKDFPSIEVGRRLIIPTKQFLEWLENSSYNKKSQ